LWAYTFTVDGPSLIDSANPNILLDEALHSSFLIVDEALSATYKISETDPSGSRAASALSFCILRSTR